MHDPKGGVYGPRGYIFSSRLRYLMMTTAMTFNLDSLIGADLNLLVLFLVLYREQNLTRTAEYMHIKQPAVSGSLVRLRIMLQDPLFIRAGRNGVRPTEKAIQMAEALLPVMGAMCEIVSRECSRTLDGPI